jgi:hypothetical protein
VALAEKARRTHGKLEITASTAVVHAGKARFVVVEGAVDDNRSARDGRASELEVSLEEGRLAGDTL